ncbi:hypothetical protein E3N88_01190 [Mikania micrantha]|uniref:Protein kinase domain-containing protein n=1 Tax=Mikania micrantha TaxID=192012 RepID=A0A5N6Q0A8_9ASTR|nr:hypothetical protein E3N88_01190 [Mikania micrantha]
MFTYSELYIATKGFSRDQILGSGGFGRVFRAVLPSDGTVAAVKCLTETGERFEKSFAAELVAVAHLRHRNLVPLRGWCVHDDQLLLVYDYMPNRSLDRLLFPRVGSKQTEVAEALVAPAPPLSWERRMKIIIFDEQQLPPTGRHHRHWWYDWVPATESFQKRAAATAKSDVFSFGIVLLEIASGRRAVDLTLPDDQIILLDRVRKLSDEKIVLQASDSRLADGSYNFHEMKQLIHLGLLCTLHDPQTRPNMRWIIEALSGGICTTSRIFLLSNPTLRTYLYLVAPPPTGNTEATTTTITASFGFVSSSSTAYATANEESLYITAEKEHGDNSGGGTTAIATAQLSRRQLNPFLMVEPPREITYKEIISATENFSDSNRLSEVDFGTAYYGVLDNHDIILRGWCTEQGEMLVVYDYSANRLLGQLLSHHNHRKSNFLQWNHRYNIVKSLACAIRYLHEEWEEQVCVRGIFGYMAPEYMENGEATPMADVYSFGVVMLEVVTGRMAVDFRRPEVLLVKKIHEFESRKGSYEELVDPRLDGEYDRKELQRVVKLAMACTQSDPNSRPR